MPQSSMMLGFTAVGNPKDELNISAGELDAANWFTRDEVNTVMKRVTEDPFLKGAFKLSHDVKLGNQLSSEQNILGYIPPRGAIAHTIIKAWLEQKI